MQMGEESIKKILVSIPRQHPLLPLSPVILTFLCNGEDRWLLWQQAVQYEGWL